MRALLLGLIVLPAATATALSAQIAPPQPLRPPQSQTQTAAAPGTATLRGHVFAADTGQPLRKAQVRIMAGEIRENRMASTDESGAYEFKEVRAGRYTIMASKGSYVNVSYGQQRPTDAAKPLEILDHQTVERVDLMLPRGAIITGRVVDEFGEPASDIQVAMERYQVIQGQRRLFSSGRSVMTNDIGEFRLFGIPPGQYYLSATWRNTSGFNPNLSPSPSERTAYAPLYFPGTMNAAEAQRITVSAAQQIDDLVMALKPIKASRVSGMATGSDGKPLTPAMIMVMQSSAAFGSMVGTTQVRPDGTFTVSGLAPGTYTLRTQRMGPPVDGPEIAMATVTVAGDDITDVQLVATKPSTLTGRIIVDPAAASLLPRTLAIGAFPASFTGMPMPSPPPARMADDYTFELKSPPGVMRLSLSSGFGPQATGWSIRSVRLNGVDVTDAGIEFKPNEDITGVEVELTNKVTTVSGTVKTSRGELAKDYTAVVFAQDKEKWTGNTRYQSAGRPDQDGRFKITGLPPGEYYAVAVDRLEQGQSGDPEFLERVRSRAVPLTLREGETRNVDLPLIANSM
jgi:protocatechuate 3,4-dioxygenase beta subunit